jgi:hypothetical protein
MSSMNSPKPTDSEQLEADLMHVLLGGGTPTGNMRLAAPSLEIKGKVEIIMQLIQKRDQQRFTFNPFDYVEPCEPECSPERHARHQGEWGLAVRITAALGPDNSKIEE